MLIGTCTDMSPACFHMQKCMIMQIIIPESLVMTMLITASYLPAHLTGIANNDYIQVSMSWHIKCY